MVNLVIRRFIRGRLSGAHSGPPSADDQVASGGRWRDGMNCCQQSPEMSTETGTIQNAPKGSTASNPRSPREMLRVLPTGPARLDEIASIPIGPSTRPSPDRASWVRHRMAPNSDCVRYQPRCDVHSRLSRACRDHLDRNGTPD